MIVLYGNIWVLNIYIFTMKRLKGNHLHLIFNKLQLKNTAGCFSFVFILFI